MTLQQQVDAIIFNAMKSIVAASAQRVVCAWCGLVMRGGPPERISHGMCAACAKFEQEQL